MLLGVFEKNSIGYKKKTYKTGPKIVLKSGIYIKCIFNKYKVEINKFLF